MFAVDRITDSYITLWSEGREICFAYQRPDQRTGGGSHDPDSSWNKGTSNLLIGDLNVKNASWSDGKHNAVGTRLMNWMQSRNL